jgi:hypothetical protein
MTRARIAAAAAGILTALLLQATVVGPALAPWPVSLPAVLVGAVALVDGPATGMSFGFATGLFADLGSRHPAGILALCWLGIGLAAGTVAVRGGRLRDVLTAGGLAGLATAAAGVALVVVHQGGTLAQVATGLLPSLAADLVLAAVLMPVVGRVLRAETLRAPHPVLTDLTIGSRRG